MCRFAAYIGHKKVLLNELLEKPNNSLISQSRAAQESSFVLNADGFGVAWYDKSIDSTAGVFKSVRPAWNDNNLHHIASKIKSDCFIGHVRASTVGDVTVNNCHPFTYKQYTFVHNGTIGSFEKIRKRLINELDDEYLNNIKARTDSEHIFALVMQYLHKDSSKNLAMAIKHAFSKVDEWQKDLGDDAYSKLNVVLTDGEQLVATRYVNKGKDPLTLHYATGEGVDLGLDDHIIKGSQGNGAVVVASEHLTDYLDEWVDVPLNHYLVIDKDLDIQINSF